MSNNQGPEIRLPGTDWKRVFQSAQEYNDWAERFAEEIRPQIEANRLKQALSEHSAR